ncbi:hypothetical protein FHY12_002564 [Xanthomonas arboricola]|nr:hypothetical protein [Xanthomonas euroxanthea]
MRHVPRVHAAIRLKPRAWCSGGLVSCFKAVSLRLSRQPWVPCMRRFAKRLTSGLVLRPMPAHRRAARAPERRSRGLAAGPLPAHHRRTRRKYVRVGSGAASMPLKVLRRWAGKDQSRWRCAWCKQGMACVVRITLRPISAPCKPSGRQASNTQPANVSSAHRMSSNTLSRKQPTNCLVRCPRRLRDRVAAWRPPPSPQGGVHGVSRER